MMMNKRLIAMAGRSKKYIYLCVVFQWMGLLANAAVIFAVAGLFGRLYEQDFSPAAMLTTLAVGLFGILLRVICGLLANRMSYRASGGVKKTLRESICQKLLRLGLSYNQHISTAEAVQLSGEGVEQLEIYFSRYMPQFFYSLLAPLTLFVILAFVNIKAALVLLVCVPLIPVSIMLVQKFAKKLLAKYWGEYVTLGDNFLENVQGLTTLKIYQADEYKNREMNAQAERFRKITMKVLTMQLNSVSLMDLVAYGGAAAGVIAAIYELAAGHMDLSGCAVVILLAADFFIPLRLLGSYFHIAMNGMAASDKMFKLLDAPEPEQKTGFISNTDIWLSDVCFSYEENREILHDVNMVFPKGLTAIVGESGSGKSTIAALLMGQHQINSGNIFIGESALSEIPEDALVKRVCLIGNQSYLFKGSVRENLLMGNPAATDAQMRCALDKTNLLDFLQEVDGLDTMLSEEAANLSGGQKQRLAIARALLHDSDIYIFDEATSNIDVESENDVMALIREMAKEKTLIVISHRLANVREADNIYVLENGALAESGEHNSLLRQNGRYAVLWEGQRKLEQYRREEVLA
ncbi:MAG: ABC transporter ATP-binding protein/permease [Oscillospiraceae bacterium]|jgi:ATP-binding cassette subfamily C protein|nr:ABC transporter ATP-binding protein/permease [Oscillospiraceae bacterium]